MLGTICLIAIAACEKSVVAAKKKAIVGLFAKNEDNLYDVFNLDRFLDPNNPEPLPKLRPTVNYSDPNVLFKHFGYELDPDCIKVGKRESCALHSFADESCLRRTRIAGT